MISTTTCTPITIFSSTFLKCKAKVVSEIISLLLIFSALTVRNIINAAQGLQWFSLGEILFIPYSKLKKIAEKYHVDEQCEVAVVRYWMQVDPIVSWRRIIHNLDLFREHSRADRLRHYAEELTGIRIITIIMFGIANFCERSDKAPRINFHSLDFVVTTWSTSMRHYANDKLMM